jgi:hypothetical protein
MIHGAGVLPLRLVELVPVMIKRIPFPVTAGLVPAIHVFAASTS